MIYSIKLSFIIFLSLLLCSCSPTMVPVMNTTITEAGQIIQTATPYITDASVAKSQAFYGMWMARDNATVKMYKLSGTTFKLDDSGRIKEITVRGDIPILQELPNKVDEYPAWAFAENIGVALIKAVLIGYGIHEVTGMIGGIAANAGSTYHGNYVTTQSNNTSGGNGSWSMIENPVVE